MKTVVIILYFIGAIAVIATTLKSKHPFKNILNSVFQGIFSLAAVNLTGLVTGVAIAVNKYTLLTLCIFGTPGCIAVLIADILFR